MKALTSDLFASDVTAEAPTVDAAESSNHERRQIRDQPCLGDSDAKG